MTKANKIISLSKVNEELKELILDEYPDGFESALKLYTLGPSKRFYAFPLSTDDCNYLIKVDVDIDHSMNLMNQD